MTRPTAHARHIRRQEAACIDFDDALETYLDGGEAEDLLRASVQVVGCIIPLDEERAEIIAVLTGCACLPVDYDDAGRAVRRWFAPMGEPWREALSLGKSGYHRSRHRAGSCLDPGEHRPNASQFSGLAGHPLRCHADCPVMTGVLAVDFLRRGGVPIGLLPETGNLAPPFRGSSRVSCYRAAGISSKAGGIG